jgi:uncharacterized protein (DUF2461 family)
MAAQTVRSLRKHTQLSNHQIFSYTENPFKHVSEYSRVGAIIDRCADVVRSTAQSPMLTLDPRDCVVQSEQRHRPLCKQCSCERVLLLAVHSV